ncbi:LysM domain-containing protein [Bacillus sp. FJAT-50079]|uniref:LysM peptidoglycan-binding domain-containing protein n=1 Tax=Bacillus sp. FJAT-50079 TaxID=2833577 RepID=UPI001BCA6473|nr:LysM domain-containing protein [Bacillus sp. FJAT-50079]MBS4209100.1 LysM peptidoglycan-binding domain-containing protein [Bacillus sp. FJAT-50079]
MKNIAALFVGLVIIYSIYYDLTVGTLSPSIVESAPPIEEQPASEPPYTLIKVKQGDTVLSIMEALSEQPLSVSIEQTVDDFIELNNGMKPDQIQVGQVYKFPLYD